MDRTSVIILVVAALLMVFWGDLVDKIVPPSPRRSIPLDVNGTGAGNNATGKTNKAPVIGPIDGKLNAIQPSILTYSDGRLQVLCRTKESVVAESWSNDRGKTWSPLQATELPNPNSGTDAVTLSDGRQLLVYNHTLRKGPFPSHRTMINVAISEDGKSWKPVLTLEKSEGEFSYPAIIQAKDGKVHITYTWMRQSVKHIVLDPEKL